MEEYAPATTETYSVLNTVTGCVCHHLPEAEGKFWLLVMPVCDSQVPPAQQLQVVVTLMVTECPPCLHLPGEQLPTACLARGGPLWDVCLQWRGKLPDGGHSGKCAQAQSLRGGGNATKLLPAPNVSKLTVTEPLPCITDKHCTCDAYLPQILMT